MLIKHIEKLDRDLADQHALVKRVEDLEQQLATPATSNYEAGRDSAMQEYYNDQDAIVELTEKLKVAKRRAREAEARGDRYTIGTDMSASQSAASRSGSETPSFAQRVSEAGAGGSAQLPSQSERGRSHPSGVPPPPRFEPESSDDSSEDGTRRRRGQVKMIVLDEVPTASGFGPYKLQIEVKVLAASRDPK